jgi:hypothetical protein
MQVDLINTRVDYAPWLLALTTKFNDTHYQTARLEGLRRQVGLFQGQNILHA